MLALDVVDVLRSRMSGAAGAAVGGGGEGAVKPPKVLIESVRTRESAAFTSIDFMRRVRWAPVPAELGVDGNEEELPMGVAFTATDRDRACEAS